VFNKKLAQKEVALQSALVAAQAANRSKTVFLNNMSHDIRTPMNAIIGYTTMAEKHIDNPESVKDYLKKISQSSAHLLSLINDVLDMSRIESGKVNINEKEENLLEIVQGLRDIVQADVNSKQLDFCVDSVGLVDEDVYCDKLRLNQVLLNIISNAIKYTPSGGSISLCITQQKTTDDYGTYEFRVKDNGIGMSEEFLKTIFVPFTRANTSTVSGIQGTGLGMAITKNIVDMMGGTITCQSVENQGSEFIVTLDLRIPKQHKETPKCEPDNEQVKVEGKEIDLSGKRLLLVEDNEFNREIAADILGETGMDIEEAEDGSIAVDKLLEKGAGYYDLVLMDIQMPIMDGYTAARTIRAFEDPKLANIPIIALSANAFEEDKQKSLAAGMNGHIAKPIDIEELMRLLLYLLSDRR
jgi:CheY-like chemotaxis protein